LAFSFIKSWIMNSSWLSMVFESYNVEIKQPNTPIYVCTQQPRIHTVKHLACKARPRWLPWFVCPAQVDQWQRGRRRDRMEMRHLQVGLRIVMVQSQPTSESWLQLNTGYITCVNRSVLVHTNWMDTFFWKILGKMQKYMHGYLVDIFLVIFEILLYTYDRGILMPALDNSWLKFLFDQLLPS
jgi:hypothetical protein